MEMPPIHTCMQLTDVNEKLVIRLKKLKKRNDSLEKELSAITEKLKIEKILREHMTVRHVAVQTDVPFSSVRRMFKKPPTQPKQEDEAQKTIDSLLRNHRNLMKKYEKEMKASTKHVETIASLNIRVQDLEKQLHAAHERVHVLEGERQRSTPRRWSRGSTPREHSGRRSRSSSRRKPRKHDGPFPLYDAHNYSPGLLSEMEAFQLERDKLAKERRKLKRELGLLDENFFEEIEDLKYALQESARLNQEYDKAMRQLCHDHGVPYPLDKLPTKQKLARKH